MFQARKTAHFFCRTNNLSLWFQALILRGAILRNQIVVKVSTTTTSIHLHVIFSYVFQVLFYQRKGSDGLMVRLSLERVVWVRDLSGDTSLCSSSRQYTLTLPLSWSLHATDPREKYRPDEPLYAYADLIFLSFFQSPPREPSSGDVSMPVAR